MDGDALTKPRRQSRDGGGLGRILIVEDDADIRLTLTTLLLDEGYEVMSCENGSQALEQLADAVVPTDAIILDLRLPVMDGWEFRAQQRADPALSGIPVIAISADASPQAAAVHADAYLHKPFDSADLLAELEKVLLERENRQIRARLEHNQRLTAIGTVAAGVAHEIKNPLTFVMGNVHLAGDTLAKMGKDLAAARQSHVPTAAGHDDGLELDVQQLQQLMREARTGLDRINTIVKDLGFLARAPDEQMEPVALYAAVDSAIGMAAHQIQRRARLVRDYKDAPSVVGQPARLTQVFLNLLINACQALPERGGSASEIRVRIRGGSVNAVVEIEDTGSGIAASLQGRIFEPFFSTKPATEGAGLGLSICRDLVATHGGTIELESELGKGSCFRVILPLAHPTYVED